MNEHSFEQMIDGMSQSSWLAAGVVPGVERRPLKKIAPDPAGLLQLMLKWRDQIFNGSDAHRQAPRYARAEVRTF
jgi:hypothetical protein